MVPVTDDPAATRLLNAKYVRAREAAGDRLPADSSGLGLAARTPEYFRKYSIVGANVIDALLPSDDLNGRTFEEIVRFRKSEHDSLSRFQDHLRELVAYVESEPWSAEFERDIIKLIDSRVIPETHRIRDKMRYAYEKMLGSIVKKSAATVTPTLIASFLSGLSAGQVLALSCAAVAGSLSIALPEIVDLWAAERDNKRNGLSFLLRFESGA